MRAFDIAIMLVILNATIGFVNAIGVFSGYASAVTPQNNYTEWDVSQIGEEYGEFNQSFLSNTWLTLLDPRFLWNAFMVFCQVLLAVVYVYPILESVFCIPDILSAVLQIGIYGFYVMGIVQFQSGRSFRYME